MVSERRLSDLVSVGPATLADFEDLGITEVAHLIDRDAIELYDQLQAIKGGYLDRCCEDVFRAAIEQARDLNLPRQKRQWHYWSKVRKDQISD